MVNIESDRVALGPLRSDLLSTYQRWHNDVATTRTYSLSQPSTSEQEAALLAELTADRDMAFFTIYARPDRQPIGTTYLTGIDHCHRRAEFGILIGEAIHRGQGYGTEATRLMLTYAFTALDLHSVMLTVYEYNLAGRRAYASAGFRETARRRQGHWHDGRFWDEIVMDCLATEYTSPLLVRAPSPAL
jgi:RimJ/RimL family protein N-acetyltransferase